MTALKISVEKGVSFVNKYALGVSLIVIPQIYIAVILTNYITENPIILETLDKVGIVIFIFLSFYFYRASKKNKVEAVSLKPKKESSFLTGITLSLLNMFSIPFFSATVIFLDAFNFFSFDILSVTSFILGSVIGTFYILFLYGKFAKSIQKKTGKITQDINLILAVLTGLVAVITLIKLCI
jgi:threonine/homoserine/homoserine lactone efflux protein